MSAARDLLAQALAKRVKDNEVIGLGSGTTVELAIKKIGDRIKTEKLQVKGVPTSERIARIAYEAGVEVLSPYAAPKLAWAFDGADEIDPQFNMIKGGGAAQLAEKIQAKRAGGKLLIIVTEEKLVNALGEKFPIPIEVVPDAVPLVEAAVRTLGATEVMLRESKGKYGPTVTEYGNFVLDVRFRNIQPQLEQELKLITGVVESGLFIGMTDEVLIGRDAGVTLRRKAGARFEETKLVL